MTKNPEIPHRQLGLEGPSESLSKWESEAEHRILLAGNVTDNGSCVQAEAGAHHGRGGRAGATDRSISLPCICGVFRIPPGPVRTGVADPEDPTAESAEVAGDRAVAPSKLRQCGSHGARRRQRRSGGASIGWSVPRAAYQGARPVLYHRSDHQGGDLAGSTRSSPGKTTVYGRAHVSNCGSTRATGICRHHTQITGESYKWDIPKDGVHAFSPDGCINCG